MAIAGRPVSVTAGNASRFHAHHRLPLSLSPVPVIKATCLRDLKDRVSIHDVVGRVVTLRTAGHARFKGLCPFHSEKTPSFNVSVDKGYYKCFGCGKAGDIINFVMENEGLQ